MVTPRVVTCVAWRFEQFFKQFVCERTKRRSSENDHAGAYDLNKPTLWQKQWILSHFYEFRLIQAKKFHWRHCLHELTTVEQCGVWKMRRKFQFSISISHAVKQCGIISIFYLPIRYWSLELQKIIVRFGHEIVRMHPVLK